MEPKDDSLALVPVSSPIEGTMEFTVVSREHIAAGTPGTGYNSNPPTSGPHWPAPAGNGIYDKELPDEQLIHNLEHGHVWVSYRPTTSGGQESTDGAEVKPGITEEELAKIKEIVEEDDWKVVLAPRANDDSKIALAAWGRVLNMDEVDLDKIKDFIETYRNRGPEKTPE